MKILVLAGGSDQIDLINELKKRGHQVVLVDYYPNPPAKRFADKHIQESTLDTEKVKQIAVSEKVDMVCTACTDQALLTVAKVSEELSLPTYLSYQTALNVTNKSYMKKVMMDNDIPTSKYMIVDKADAKLARNFQYPLVVKPVDCNSSKGVVKVFDEKEVEDAIANAISLSRTQTAVVEEFISGEEVSADFYIQGNEVKFLCATKSNKIKNTTSFTITQSYYPVINEAQEAKLTVIAGKIAKAFDLKDTPLLVQLILHGDDFYVLEFSARMGGGSKHKVIETISGVDIMKVYVDRILGAKPTVNPQKMVKFATMNYVYCNNGMFVRIEGREEVRKNNLIVADFQYKMENNTITKHETSGDRVMGYLVVADSLEEMAQKIKTIDNSLKIIDDKGNDIMIHNING